jgi:hypothetical protein
LDIHDDRMKKGPQTSSTNSGNLSTESAAAVSAAKPARRILSAVFLVVRLLDEK